MSHPIDAFDTAPLDEQPEDASTERCAVTGEPAEGPEDSESNTEDTQPKTDAIKPDRGNGGSPR
jgi:hypothetical protein